MVVVAEMVVLVVGVIHAPGGGPGPVGGRRCGDGGRHRSCHSGRCGGGGRDGFNSVCGGLGDGRCI